MKHVAVLAVVFFASLLCGFTPAEWVKVQGKGGKFSLIFPAKPEETEQTVETEVGPLTMKLMMYEVGKLKDDNALYGVIYADYPETVISSGFKDEMIEAFFDNSVRGAAANIRGTVISEKKISYRGYPGRSAKVSFMDGQGIMNVQVLLVKSRGYILEVGCEAKKDNNPSIDKFFKSFTLTEPVKK